MNKIKNFSKKILYVIAFLMFVVLPYNVKADTPHGLNLKMVRVDSTKYTLDSYAAYENFKADYSDGNLDGYIIDPSTDEIDPGTTIMFILNYVPGSPQVITSVQTRINFDPSIWTAAEDEDGLFAYVESDQFPSRSSYVTDWNYSPTQNVVAGSFIDNKGKPLTRETELVYFFMTLSESATGTVGVEFSKMPGTTDVADADGTQYAYDISNSDIAFKVAGDDVSKDASLGTLSVSSSKYTYDLTPAFVPGNTDNKTYSTVVSSDTDQITISATAFDKGANVAPLSIGTKSLNVGDNEFKITVTSEFGNSEVYTLKVYRLSNDATLKSISFTNGISIGALEDGKFNYSTTIPYATSSTTVTAVTNHPNAFITNGTGDWTLQNSGDLLNENVIVVRGENCLDKYQSVPGNTCLTGNNSIKNYQITITRTAASTNNYLKTLTINNSEVTGFNKETTSYDLGNVSNATTSMVIGGEVEDTGKATVTGLETVNLAVGENTFKVTVTAEDKSTRDYNVRVYRLSNDNKLSGLTVTSTPESTPPASLFPAFSEESKAYSYSYGPKVESITVSAIVKDTDKAKVVIYDKDTTEDLSGLVSVMNTATATFDLNTSNVGIMVTAEDGTVDTYTLTLTRLKSSDTTLSSLSIDHGTLSPEFQSGTRVYTATVDPTIESITVTAVPTSKFAKIKSITGNDNLKFGTNRITIAVEPEEGDVNYYYINVTRQKYSIATLDDIKVGGVSIPEFNPETEEYTLDNVPFEKDKVVIETTKTNSLATVTGDGEVSLNTGDNKIKILVTAHDGTTTKEYKINIYRTKNSDKSISNLKVKGIDTLEIGDGLYQVTVPNDVTQITPDDITFTKSDDATSEITKTIDLTTKNVNIYDFKVYSEDGTEKVYTVRITRKESGANTLSKITLVIGEDKTRHCLMDQETKTCLIRVPATTTSFKLETEISDEATISPVDGEVYNMPADESEKTITLTVKAENNDDAIYTLNVERVKSSNANLTALKVGGVSVPNFSPTTHAYEVEVDGNIDSIAVEATVEDIGKAKVVTDLSKHFPLNFDVRNQIDVTVQAEDETQKTYTIYVTRKHRKDALLSNLTINGETIDGFASDEYEYTLPELPYNTHQLNIKATPNDPLASASGDGLVRVNTGTNTITITVTAHDTEVTQDYTIYVSRAPNTDTGIKRITLADVEATYNTKTKKYSVKVPHDVKVANRENLKVIVNDPITDKDVKATATFTDTELKTTEITPITITVTAESGRVDTYTLEVERQKCSVATLGSLEVTNGSFKPSFSSDVYDYEVTLPVDALDFDVTAETTDEHASITSGVGHYVLSEMTENKVEVVVVSEDESDTKKYTLTINRTSSSSNELSGITLSEGTLDPEFKPNVTSYTVNVGGSVSSIDIGATTVDSRATIVSGTGTHNLKVGSNPITIHVKSESGANLYYSIEVIRAEKEDNLLTDLTVDGETVPGFDPEVGEYTLSDVAYDKTSIEIGYTKSDNDATVLGVGRKALKTGLNTFNVVVTAQNGTKNTYTIKVTRKKNDNAYLSLLTVNGYTLTPNFDGRNEFNYEITVDPKKTTLTQSDVRVVTEDVNATFVKNNGEDLELSTTLDNFFQIVVTAEDGTTRKRYSIKVNRPKSSDNKLSKVELTNGVTMSPALQDDIFEYTLTIPYGETTNFSINGIANDPAAKVIGNDEYNLDSKVFQLIVQAEDGTPQIYKFHIVQAASTDATLNNLSVSGYALDKKFGSTTLNYSIGEIPSGTTELVINATPTNQTSKVEYFVEGVKQDSNTVTIPDVLGGPKTITIKVTAPDQKTTKSYNINYTVVPSANVYLSELVPSVGTINFLKTVKDYEITVENEVESISFDITTEDENASISVNDGESFFTPKKITIDNLKVGTNTVNILVTAQDGTSKDTYTVVVKRLDVAASDDAYLSSLSVDGYTLNKTFDMEELEYSIGEIPYSLTELNINAIANMGSSSIDYLVNGIEQSGKKVTLPKTEGQGIITIKVTAEDGHTTKNYKVTYTKKASENAYLKSLVVSKGTLSPAFEKDKFSYTVDVGKDVNSIDITATLDDTTATMSMNGTIVTSPHTLTLSSLTSGENKVTILVTAENGVPETYTITINKESDGDIPKTITSEEYGHKIEDGYIKTVRLNATGIDMKNQLDNDNKYLEIWNSKETEKVSDSDILATGMIVKLIINGKEEDRKIIVIKGDTSGEGEIDLLDAVDILNHVLSKPGKELTGAYLQAAYVSPDTEADLQDAVAILNHVLHKPGKELY